MRDSPRHHAAEHAPSPTKAVALAGSLKIRVRYSECDPMGVVHHASYIPWLEMGRTELLRDAGVSYSQLERAGVFLVIVKLECSYKRPGRYDDLIEVRTRVISPPSPSRVKIRHEYEVFRAESTGGQGEIGDLLLSASSLLACVDRTGRPAALPDWLVTGGAGPSP